MYNSSRPLSHSKIVHQQQATSHQNKSSGSSPQGNKNETLPPKSGGSGLKIIFFALSGFALGIGYISLNPETRKQVETYVPQSKTLFELIDSMLLKQNDKAVTSDSFPTSVKSPTTSNVEIKKAPEISELKYVSSLLTIVVFFKALLNR